MNEADLAAQLALLLGEELADRIPDLDRVLLALDREPSDADLLAELRRLLHVIKGASRSAGKVEIEQGTHEIETSLADVAPGTAIPPEILATAAAFVKQLEVARMELSAPPPTTTAIDTVPDAQPEPSDASIRVAADDLDLMMGHSAAVLIARQDLADPIKRLAELQIDLASKRSLGATQLAAVTRELGALHRTLARATSQLGTASTMLDLQVRRSRLRSVLEACRGCERLVHDAAESAGKLAELVVRGGEVRVDRSQIQVLREILIQLVRNSVAHGIEPPDIRTRAGKPPRGKITIDAQVLGDAVRVTVSDDGAGLDLHALAARGAERGVRVETMADAARVIFAAGLSTARTVTELSGRGVGLDVVKRRIEAMHGTISVDSVPGASTTFTISLPTTVATITALVVVADGVHYAVPTSVVERVIRVERAHLRYVDGRSLVQVGEPWIPTGSLAQVLGGSPQLTERTVAMILVQGDRRIAVQIDVIVGMFDLAVGSLDARLGRLRHITGQARLPNGAVALLLNATDVTDDVLGMAVAAPLAAAPVAARRRILVADDSATTRALEANILTTAGYDVTVAVDGEAALRELRNGTFDLLVSDIDMPNLDGFGLAQAVRAIDRFATLPIILVTARSTDEDREKGMRVGASAYLVKSSFDQTVLLQTIERLL